MMENLEFNAKHCRILQINSLPIPFLPLGVHFVSPIEAALSTDRTVTQEVKMKVL